MNETSTRGLSCDCRCHILCQGEVLSPKQLQLDLPFWVLEINLLMRPRNAQIHATATDIAPKWHLSDWSTVLVRGLRGWHTTGFWAKERKPTVLRSQIDEQTLGNSQGWDTSILRWTARLGTLQSWDTKLVATLLKAERACFKFLQGLALSPQQRFHQQRHMWFPHWGNRIASAGDLSLDNLNFVSNFF